MTPEARFWSKVEKTPACWTWIGTLGGDSYGRIKVGGRGTKMALAHRVSYEMARGPVPVGLELDHLCRNRRCVNPLHLEAVTHRVNCRRGLQGAATAALNLAKTHCPRGHAYEGENVITRRTRSGGTSRTCRECERARGRLITPLETTP